MIKILYYTILFSFLLIACNSDAPKGETQPVDEKTNPATTERQILVPPDNPPAMAIDSSQIDSSAIVQKAERPSRKPAKIKFDHLVFHYDTIQQGDIIKHNFTFTNIGERPLTIKNVYGSCGCTIGSYPFLDIAPNEQSVIKAKFDSKGKSGQQETTITIESNGSPSSQKVTLKGYVVAPKKKD